MTFADDVNELHRLNTRRHRLAAKYETLAPRRLEGFQEAQADLVAAVQELIKQRKSFDERWKHNPREPIGMVPPASWLEEDLK